MKQKTEHLSTDRHRRNMQFIEERLELLDTIREMIDIEFERRGMNTRDDPPPEHPPPEPKGRDPADASAGKEARSICHTLRKCIVRLFKRAAP